MKRKAKVQMTLVDTTVSAMQKYKSGRPKGGGAVTKSEFVRTLSPQIAELFASGCTVAEVVGILKKETGIRFSPSMVYENTRHARFDGAAKTPGRARTPKAEAIAPALVVRPSVAESADRETQKTAVGRLAGDGSEQTGPDVSVAVDRKDAPLVADTRRLDLQAQMVAREKAGTSSTRIAGVRQRPENDEI